MQGLENETNLNLFDLNASDFVKNRQIKVAHYSC